MDQPGYQRVVHCGEEWIFGDHGQLVVEGHVGTDEFGRNAHGSDIEIELLFELVDVLIRRVERRLPGNARFKKQTDLLQMNLSNGS